MAYVDYDFYTTIYFGEAVNEDDFPRLEARARDKIDEITFYRIQTNGLDFYNDSIQLRIKKAVCAQIEYFVELGGTTAVSVNNPDTVSLGRTSVKANEFASTAIGTDQNVISPDARKYLAKTGLLYAGVGVMG
ncbi:hypothetical protein [Listeria booriae]|uniref:hypothetical protein n=1 Tax=Listeria booriae TaxID=1552123 RepID=UPI0016268512|nr:hypothetical protein [Listeria booriae]MBC2318780.1 hypothetical protein [Listeria booriae]